MTFTCNRVHLYCDTIVVKSSIFLQLYISRWHVFSHSRLLTFSSRLDFLIGLWAEQLVKCPGSCHCLSYSLVNYSGSFWGEKCKFLDLSEIHNVSKFALLLSPSTYTHIIKPNVEVVRSGDKLAHFPAPCLNLSQAAGVDIFT